MMKKRFLTHRITLALALGALVLPGCVWALPQGGTVVTGNGSYTTGSDKMDITGSGNMSVKWDSFNVADNEAVNFKGMNAILNYVTGKQGSEIYGALNGEGVHVFLINPNGVLFGKTAQVNVGALTVSTKTLADVDGTLQNFKSTGAISAFGTAGDAVLINMGKLEADTLHFEGSRIILDTDNVTLGGNGFDGSRAVINGDYANDNVILGYTAYEDGSYAGKDKTFAVNDGAQQVNGYMWVEDAAQLQDINTNLKGNYALKNDIDAGESSQKGFTQLGASGNMFYGHLDGLGYSIKDLTINKYANFMGLFYQTAKSSKIRNLILENINVTGYSANGTIAGANQGLIENIVVTGSVDGVKGINGGIVGINAGIIRNIIVDINVNGGGNALGGIAGQNQAAGSIVNVTVEGEIGNSAFDVVGGIVGDNSGQLNNVHNKAIVTGHDAVAGIVGQNKAAYTVNNATNTNDITGNDYVGGIVGYYSNADDMLLINSNNSGNITGNSMVGGIVGSGGGSVIGGGGLSGCVSIENAENSGNTTGTSSVGGIMGGSGYTKLIDKVTNYGTVTGKSQVGGILGNTSSGNIGDALNLGQVSAENSCGGIVGFGSDATVSDNAVYATTDKAGNAYDTSKYNDKGVGMTYAEIFPAPPEPPPTPVEPEVPKITQLPEFEENYRSSSASVSAELHTPVMVSPVAENINSGSGSLEVHDGESTFGDFSNTLGAADNVLSAETEAEHGAAGLSSPSSSDEPGGSRAGSGAGSDNVVNGEDDVDQEEQNNEKI